MHNNTSNQSTATTIAVQEDQTLYIRSPIALQDGEHIDTGRHAISAGETNDILYGRKKGICIMPS